MTSAKSLRFNFDALLVGVSGTIVCRGYQRFCVSGIPRELMAEVARAHERSDFLAEGTLTPSLVERLEALGLLVEHARPTVPPKRQIGLTPRHTLNVARPLSFFGSIPGLAFVATVATALTVYQVDSIFGDQSVTGWMLSTSLHNIFISAIVLLLCVCVHELGHAASSIWHTGTVGGIRFTLYRGAPAFAIDVSTVSLTNRAGQASIALAGIVFQWFISILILCLADNEAVLWGARMSLLASAFSILPLPKTDGYWLLVDVSGVRLSPKLFSRPMNKLNLVYGTFVLLVSMLIIYIILREAQNLGSYSIANIYTESARAVFFGTIGIYAVGVAMVFARTAIKQMIYGIEEAR